MLLGALDTYVVVTIMTDIMKDVGIAINQIQRVTPIVTGYLLGYIAAMPLLGGRRTGSAARCCCRSASPASRSARSITALSSDLTSWSSAASIQGTASGALLPVTLALAADLWAARNRAAVLGGIGAAQELGSVLGPLYGIALVWAVQPLARVFWVNVPLAVDRDGDDPLQPAVRAEGRDTRRRSTSSAAYCWRSRSGLAVVGLYNPAPDGKQVLPS